MHQHMQQPCYSKLRPPSLWNGTSIISSVFFLSFFFFFLLSRCFMFLGTIFDNCWSLKRRAGRGGGQSGHWRDHTLRNRAILSGLGCDGCDWLFHQGVAAGNHQQLSGHTSRSEAQRFRPIRTFSSDNLYAAVTRPPFPALSHCCCCCWSRLLFHF